ncbi:unnamed protein product [Musa banksii]
MKPLFSSHIFDGNKQNKLNIRKLCVLNSTVPAIRTPHPALCHPGGSRLHQILIPPQPQPQPHPLRVLSHQGRLPGARHGPPRQPRQGLHRSLLAPCLRGGHTGMRRALHQEQAHPLHHAPRPRDTRHRPRGAVHPHRLACLSQVRPRFRGVQDNRDGSRLFLIP